MDDQTAINEHLPLVKSIVNRINPKHDQYNDYMQIGSIGLLKAARTWNSTKGKFSTYATACIRNEIYKEFRSISPLLTGDISKKYCYPTTELSDMLLSMDDTQRTIAEMRYAGYTQKEIGRYLGRSRMWVRGQIKNIMAAIL